VKEGGTSAGEGSARAHIGEPAERPRGQGSERTTKVKGDAPGPTRLRERKHQDMLSKGHRTTFGE